MRNLLSHSQLYETIKSFTVRHLKFNLNKQILLLFKQIQNDILHIEDYFQSKINLKNTVSFMVTWTKCDTSFLQIRLG